MKEPMDRLVAEVIKHVVHPAHVLFEGEAQSSGIGGTRDFRPGGGLLAHSSLSATSRRRYFHTGRTDRESILPPSVRDRDRVSRQRHPQRMLSIQPKEPAVQKKVPDLDAVIVEDAAIPVRMVAESRVGMALARIIHEGFYCTRRYENQNLLRFSFFAPRSYKGRSTSQARWRRT